MRQIQNKSKVLVGVAAAALFAWGPVLSLSLGPRLADLRASVKAGAVSLAQNLALLEGRSAVLLGPRGAAFGTATGSGEPTPPPSVAAGAAAPAVLSASSTAAPSVAATEAFDRELIRSWVLEEVGRVATAGPQGPKGDKGDPGLQGPSGPAGSAAGFVTTYVPQNPTPQNPGGTLLGVTDLSAQRFTSNVGNFTQTLNVSGAASFGSLSVSGAASFGSVSYTWPGSGGTAGQALTTDGAGTLSWTTVSGGSVAATGTPGTFAYYSATSTISSQSALYLSGTKIGVGVSDPQASLNLASSGTLQVGSSTDATYTQLSSNRLQFSRAGASSYIDQAAVGGSLVFRTSSGTPFDTSAITILSTGKIGINDPTPDRQLHVFGSGSASDGIAVGGASDTAVPNPGSVSNGVIINVRGYGLSADAITLGSAYQPSYGIGVALNRAAPALSIKNGGGPALAVESGSVGIGTSSPQQALDVVGSLRLSTGGFLAPDNSGNRMVLTNTGVNTFGQFQVQSLSSNPLMTVLNTGQVGIGTSSPVNTLDVVGTLRLSTGDIYAPDGSGVRVRVLNSGLNTFGTTTLYSFTSNPILTGTNAGNVGIGTLAPGAKLHVSDGNSASSTLTAPMSSPYLLGTSNAALDSYLVSASNTATQRGVYGIVRARGTVTTPTAVQADDAIGTLLFGGFDGSQTNLAGGVFAYADGSPTAGSSTPVRLSLVTGGNAVNRQERLTVTNAGSVGIGTTTPTAQLHTTGTVRFSNYGVGTLTTDAAGNLIITSDERLKNITGLFTRGMDAVLGLEPVNYTWKPESGNETEHSYTGFSAQNVQANIPEAVGVTPGGFLTLSDRPVLAAVVNAVKEQHQKFTDLEQLVKDIDARTVKPQREGLADLEYQGSVRILGHLAVRGHISVGRDTAGSVTVPKGATSAEVVFDSNYEWEPVITVTPVNFDGRWKLVEPSAKGFKLYLAEPGGEDVRFNWHVFGTVDQPQVAGAPSVSSDPPAEPQTVTASPDTLPPVDPGLNPLPEVPAADPAG